MNGGFSKYTLIKIIREVEFKLQFVFFFCMINVSLLYMSTGSWDDPFS